MNMGIKSFQADSLDAREHEFTCVVVQMKHKYSGVVP